MSFSPESFDRLLADKLAQASPPAYEPAHWDQLEDQLQHFNQAVHAAQPAASAPASLPVAAPLAGKLATIGVSALLAGLTAVNGYFFYAATTAREATPAVNVTQPMAAAPAPPRVEVPVTSVPTTRPAVAPSRFVATAPARPAARRATRVSIPVAAPSPLPSHPAASEAPTVQPFAAAAPAPAPTGVDATAPASVASRPDSATASRSGAAGREAATPDDRSLAVPNVITPNGDGLNDHFELPLAAGACRLTVFDRTNHVVFSAERYDNAWDGGNLPAGTYLYVIETTGTATWRTGGALTIVR